MPKHNYYEILNCETHASFNELKSNYKKLALQCHPDKLQQDGSDTATITDTNSSTLTTFGSHADPNAKSNRKFVAINEAWNTLKDPAKRKLYDSELLLEKFQMHSNIFERLTLADMKRCTTNASTMEPVTTGKESGKSTAHSNDEEIGGDVEEGETIFYTYNCRCGGQYIVDDDSVCRMNSKCRRDNGSDSDKVACDAGDKDDDDDNDDGEVVVECTECSLVIILNG